MLARRIPGRDLGARAVEVLILDASMLARRIPGRDMRGSVGLTLGLMLPCWPGGYRAVTRSGPGHRSSLPGASMLARRIPGRDAALDDEANWRRALPCWPGGYRAVTA